LVTSTAEVLLPRCADLIFMLPDQTQSRPQRGTAKAEILSQSDLGIEPVLRFPPVALNVYVWSLFLPRKEVEAKSRFLENRRAHRKKATTPGFCRLLQSAQRCA
jgi:hypothetical protein